MLKKIVVAFVFIGLMLFATTGILIYSEFSGDSPKCEKIQYLIILGAKVRQEGVSPTLQRRLDKTLPVLKNDTNIIVIVSGGKGDDEPISEAKAMSDYLISKGIKASRIISEDQSFSTEENINNSKKLLLSSSNPIPIYLSTSNYHQYRAQLIAKKAGFEPYGLSSTTPNTELPYRTFREMIAIIVGWI